MPRARRSLAALGAGLLALLAGGTAAAAPPGAGTLCEMSLLTDGEAGASGFVWFDAWAAPGDQLTVRCTIQNTPDHAGFDLYQASASGTSAVTLPPTPAGVPVAPWETLYLCTQLDVVHDGVPATYQFDADGNPDNGAQCAKSERTETPAGTVITVIAPYMRYCIGPPENPWVCVPCGTDCPLPPIPPSVSGVSPAGTP